MQNFNTVPLVVQEIQRKDAQSFTFNRCAKISFAYCCFLCKKKFKYFLVEFVLQQKHKTVPWNGQPTALN